MRFKGLFCAVAVAAAALVLVGYVSAQQSGQTGAGTTSGTTSNANAGNTNANAGNSTNNTTNNPMDRGIRSRTNTNPDNQIQTRRQQQSPLMLSGKVVLDDGSPAPMGTVIVRDCTGKVTREVNVGPDGGFGFQVGGNNGLMPDASDSNFTNRADPLRSSPSVFSFPDDGIGSASRLAGCELRAQIGGYRSSSVMLTTIQGMGVVDVGTIVLYPTTRVSGTTVSVTNLAAPKDAKKALERAEKAYQKKKLDEAEKYTQTALKAYPGFASAWFQLGLIYNQSQRTEEARSAYSKALETDGKYVNPLLELARLAAKESNWREAVALTDRALELDPIDLPDGYYINALANYNLNDMNAAERSARKLERLDGLHQWPQVHLIMAGILHLKKDWSGEAAELRSYLKNSPASSMQERVRSRIRDLENGKQ